MSTIEKIVVGGWKLEDSKDKLVVATDGGLHTQMLGLLTLIPANAHQSRGVHDLVGVTSADGCTVFTLKTYLNRSVHNRAHVNAAELRFMQGVRIGEAVCELTSIFHTPDFTIHQPPMFEGGRKILPWNRDVLDRVMIGGSRPAPALLPVYATIEELAKDVEKLCPVTEPGMIEKLRELPAGIERARATEFEELAQELTLTI